MGGDVTKVKNHIAVLHYCNGEWAEQITQQ